MTREKSLENRWQDNSVFESLKINMVLKNDPKPFAWKSHLCLSNISVRYFKIYVSLKAGVLKLNWRLLNTEVWHVFFCQGFLYFLLCLVFTNLIFIISASSRYKSPVASIWMGSPVNGDTFSSIISFSLYLLPFFSFIPFNNTHWGSSVCQHCAGARTWGALLRSTRLSVRSTWKEIVSLSYE